MSYSARILADSISPDDVRLTTLEIIFPRFMLAELNTHRMFSRNSASSRAIPPEKQIERVMQEPFVPETFNARVKGMGVGDVLDDQAQEDSRAAWLGARDDSVAAARELLNLGVDKSRINRLLEPFMWHTAIVSATEWDNFFALRCPPGEEPDITFPAQLEFQRIAILMRRAMAESVPRRLVYGAWHLPLLLDYELGAERDIEEKKLISVRRCARVSFDKHLDTEPRETSIEKARDLMASGHLSPFECVARPLHPGEGNYHIKSLGDGDKDPKTTFIGNFRGWVQMRKEIPGEANHAEAVALQA